MNKYFNRILIIGNGGSGKSTLARNLKKKLKIPVLHIDKIYWPNYIDDNKKIFNQKINSFIKKPKWIIEGTPMLNIEKRIQNADTIIFIDFSLVKCIFRIIKRRFLYFLKKYPYDDGCPTIKIKIKDISWLIKFNKIHKKNLLSYIKNKKTNDFIFYFIKNNNELKSLYGQIPISS